MRKEENCKYVKLTKTNLRWGTDQLCLQRRLNGTPS